MLSTSYLRLTNFPLTFYTIFLLIYFFIHLIYLQFTYFNSIGSNNHTCETVTQSFDVQKLSRLKVPLLLPTLPPFHIRVKVKGTTETHETRVKIPNRL